MYDTTPDTNAIYLYDLKDADLGVQPDIRRRSDDELVDIASRQLDRSIRFTDAAAFELTARRPHTDAGRMDFYRPGRWDCEIDLVFMSAIVTGPSPGMWEGTVGYVRYVTPNTGLHLVAIHFSGYQTTMEARGPWGLATAYSPTTSDHPTVTALWQANAGDLLNFTIQCKGDGIGYLESIRVQLLSD